MDILKGVRTTDPATTTRSQLRGAIIATLENEELSTLAWRRWCDNLNAWHGKAATNRNRLQTGIVLAGFCCESARKITRNHQARAIRRTDRGRRLARMICGELIRVPAGVDVMTMGGALTYADALEEAGNPWADVLRRVANTNWRY